MMISGPPFMHLRVRLALMPGSRRHWKRVLERRVSTRLSARCPRRIGINHCFHIAAIQQSMSLHLRGLLDESALH